MINFDQEASTLKTLRSRIALMLMSVAILTILSTVSVAHAIAPATVGNDFYYTFNSSGTLLESASAMDSSSPYFYLNSGGKLVIKDGVGTTISGELSSEDHFYSLYSASNSLDTDGGSHPQNLFRLLTRSKWQDTVSRISFQITAQNLSTSPNRDGHNGVLLMSRYQDSNNLYYAGVRNDGLAVIKKKINSRYYTLAAVQIFGVSGKYDRENVPSLLPLRQWTGLKTEVYNLSNGAVRIRLLLDRENDGSFVSILAADDDGVGGKPFIQAGYSGVRTDFMDVKFDNWRLTAI